jgi:hypothetical protein
VDHGLTALADPPKPEPLYVQQLRQAYDLDRLCRVRAFTHQVVGVDHLVKQPFAALFDEMGAGKTKQVIDAAQVMMQRSMINRVIVITPASVRGVWYEPELGELRKHLWETDGQHHRVIEFHSRKREWHFADGKFFKQFEVNAKTKQWVITNYEFIRQVDRLQMLLKFAKIGPTLLVLDESSAVKNWGAQQTEAANYLRLGCARVVLLNGTPIAHSPLDMYAQGRIMHPKILECKTFFHFRAKYATLGGYKNRQVTGWKNLEDMQRRFKPYVLRRLKVDCIDLPPKLPPVTMPVAMTEDTWRIYKSMRDDLIVFIENNVSATQHAFVKAIRLAQITSGFLGGLSTMEDVGLNFEWLDPEDRPEWLPQPAAGGPAGAPSESPQGSIVSGQWGNMGPLGENLKQQEFKVIGREKLDLFLTWLRGRLEEDSKFKVVVFSRFRAEVERTYQELTTQKEWRHLHVGRILGGQKREDRERSVKLLDPRAAPDGPVVVVGTQDSGSLGMTLTAASTMFRLSVNYNLKAFLQGADRIHRPSQLWPCSYFDAVATGPQGQKTIDHAVLKALYAREDVATWTASAWLSALREE